LLLFFFSSDKRKNKSTANQIYSKKWDELLEESWKAKDELWSKSIYNEHFYNCFDFVIKILIDFGFFEEVLSINTNKIDAYGKVVNFLKQELSKKFIEPEFVKCLKYLNLLEKLSQKQYMIEKIN
jgi:hypothetical protein